MTIGMARALAAVLFVFALAMMLFLYGCATDQPVARVETVEAKIPVAVACVTPEQIPAVPAKAAISADADLKQRAAGLGAELLERRQYDAQVAPLLAACSTVPTPAKGKP